MEFNSESDLLKHTKKLIGKTVIDLLGDKSLDKGKGGIGNVIEREAFGISNNNDERPDFHQFGIELKVIPLKSVKKGSFSVKERTKVCSINYQKIIQEKWQSSHAKNKLNKILFVFYIYNKEQNELSEIINYTLFDLSKIHEEPIIQSDWERTQKLVNEGLAHELSESQNIILAASRSGAGKLPEDKWPIQPNTKFQERARQRAFSLKPSFTKTIWQELNSKKPLNRIFDIQEYKNYNDLEKFILEKLNLWKGKTLAEFAKEHNIEIKKSKDKSALILRNALGFNGSNKNDIRELLQMGIKVKTTPIRTKDYYPYESMSFPFQPLGEIKEETRFDESEFYTYLQGFLFIPLFRDSKENNSPEDIRFGKSFIWRPAKSDLLKIQKEWELIHDTICSGIKTNKKITNNKKGFIIQNNLPSEKNTNYIHMRPHARDSNDIDYSIEEIGISKQCFWFNKKLIQKLVKENQ